MKFAELTKRIKLSPSRKTEYFLKYKSFTDKEKLFLEELIRISYNLGMQDVTKEHLENYQRLFPEPENNLTGLNLTEQNQSGTLLPEVENIESSLTGLKYLKEKKRKLKSNLTGLKTKGGKIN